MRNLIVWLVIMFSAAGLGDVMYLSRQRNSSVEFSCMSTNVKAKPFAFSLMRNLLKPEKVLYLNFGSRPSIFNEKDKNRIVVQVDSSHCQVTVNISHLLGRHTDLYRCVFHYDSEKFEDYPGKTEFFLYVEDFRVGDVVYLSRQRNSSVEFSCMSINVNTRPFAFSLMRDLVKSEKVLYLNFGNSPSIFDEKDKNRIFVQVDERCHQVTVNITHLLGRHTDLYRCVFHYDSEKFEDYPGKTQFFLYVEDFISEECTCYSYEPLLYALSAASVLLFMCVLIFAGVYCKRPCSQPKPLAVVIYEEMNGVRTTKGEASSCHFGMYLKEQEETEMSVYTLPLKKKPCDPSPGSDPDSI